MQSTPSHAHDYMVWGGLMAVAALASAGYAFVLVEELRHRLRRARAWWG